MPRIFAAVLGLWMAATAAFAQDAGAIADVIGSQLQAFNERDVDGAWSHASPMIQGLFGNPENFGMMVQRGYPMVWDNAEVRFLELREIAGEQWQKIMIRDASGGLHMLDYQMIETADGWQINGVQLLRAPDVGA
ncbi:DUF4864 domain-containing protein [Yoonia sp.]|uniref:DUF4864 domain-containing protein n=1 Tax=Yoonia sp. TaxID=2212373 RepID=UPI0025F5DF3A|nr:DUF4864 domain-containing protein [Yoonia sp.]